MSSRLYWFNKRLLPILDIRFVLSGGYELRYLLTTTLVPQNFVVVCCCCCCCCCYYYDESVFIRDGCYTIVSNRMKADNMYLNNLLKVGCTSYM